MAFGWLSDGFRGFRLIAAFPHDRRRSYALRRTYCYSCRVYILHDSFEGVVVDVLIYTKITEVIENCRVMEFSRNKFDGPRSKVVDGCHEGLCQDECPMRAVCCVEQPKYNIYLHCSLDEQVSGWLSDGF